MKRKELEKRLRRAGCYLKREGASHSLWINPQTGVISFIIEHLSFLSDINYSVTVQWLITRTSQLYRIFVT